MKQLKWVIILLVTAVALTGVFLAVDKKAKQREKQKKAAEGRQLYSIDINAVTRIVIDGDDGHFAFDWSPTAGSWQLVSADQFNLNIYAVQAICNAFCDLKSEKTVAFDCKDTSVYGFDHPVTVQVYTTETGSENPYILYVGDNTPTYESYYAMVDGSNDIYTIDYSSGSMFCVAKNTLKNMYLFDTNPSGLRYIRQETTGEPVLEFRRDDNDIWQMNQPDMHVTLDRSAIETLANTLIRLTVSGYLEENPEDLSQYGLDKPIMKLILKGNEYDMEKTPKEEEIWFGKKVSDKQDETEMYGYFVKSSQLFKIKNADYASINLKLTEYLNPYCISVGISDLDGISVDMGDVYDLKADLKLDSENDRYWLDGKEITDPTVLTLYQSFYQSIVQLRYTDVDLDAKPEGDPAITICYRYKDGSENKLEFIQFADNNFYLMQNGQYCGQTVRLNRFTSVNSITKNYEALILGMK
ncbi:MAG: DUF4340 domain-containing protein [Oscillospiraceae bacterium]|nr:DUF4340 domain-containing protein [Oscillospiraceae bacterium]